MARRSVYMHVLLSEVDNGGEFFAKIPVDDLLYCTLNLCEGSMTTCYLKVYSHIVMSLNNFYGDFVQCIGELTSRM